MANFTFERECRKWPVELHNNHSIDADRTWIFTDGGGAGWYAAVIIRPCCEERRITGCQQSSSNNVGAELDGVILGLDHTMPREKISIVSDYLWTGYYINGWCKVHHDYLYERVIQARKVIKEQKLTDVLFIHHGGHQGDQSVFSYWNKIADQLCREKRLVNVSVSLS